jgi:hypothetical protein
MLITNNKKKKEMNFQYLTLTGRFLLAAKTDVFLNPLLIVEINNYLRFILFYIHSIIFILLLFVVYCLDYFSSSC